MPIWTTDPGGAAPSAACACLPPSYAPTAFFRSRGLCRNGVFRNIRQMKSGLSGRAHLNPADREVTRSGISPSSSPSAARTASADRPPLPCPPAPATPAAAMRTGDRSDAVRAPLSIRASASRDPPALLGGFAGVSGAVRFDVPLVYVLERGDRRDGAGPRRPPRAHLPRRSRFSVWRTSPRCAPIFAMPSAKSATTNSGRRRAIGRRRASARRASSAERVARGFGVEDPRRPRRRRRGARPRRRPPEPRAARADTRASPPASGMRRRRRGRYMTSMSVAVRMTRPAESPGRDGEERIRKPPRRASRRRRARFGDWRAP